MENKVITLTDLGFVKQTGKPNPTYTKRIRHSSTSDVDEEVTIYPSPNIPFRHRRITTIYADYPFGRTITAVEYAPIDTDDELADIITATTSAEYGKKE